MAHTIILSDEEVTELETLIEDGLNRTHDELRHTENFEYRDVLKHNLLIIERLRKMLGSATTAA